MKALVSSALASALMLFTGQAYSSGVLSLTWSLVGATNNTLTCASVGAVTLEVSGVPAGGGGTQINDFACSTFSGTTTGWPAGAYTVDVSLLDTSRNLLSHITLPTSVIDGNVTQLGNFVFQFATTPVRLQSFDVQ